MEQRVKIDGDAGLVDYLQSLARQGKTIRSLTVFHITDAGLEAVARCPQMAGLIRLRCQASQVTDNGMKTLIQSIDLGRLQSIQICSDALTDNTVKIIAHARRQVPLLALDLTSNQLTDACAEELARRDTKLTRLRVLGLRNTRLTERGIGNVARIPDGPELRRLYLTDTPVTDSGTIKLTQTQCLANLTWLDLSDTLVADRGVEALAMSQNQSRLRCLYLNRTQVSDDGLAALAQSPYLSDLRVLELSDTKVSLQAQVIESKSAPVNLRFFQESRSGSPLFEVKVPILGMGGVGKSILTRHLAADRYAYQADNAATHAFEEQNISVPVSHSTRGNHSCSLRLFDFGGQPELHGAHRFFLADRRNVYIIVASARRTREENRLGYWLRMVKHHGNGAPVVVVVSHCDDEKGAGRPEPCKRLLPQLDAHELAREHGLFVQVVDDYSNCDGKNINGVLDAIQRGIEKLETVFMEPFPPGFFELRNWLLGKSSPRLSNCPAFKRYWTVAEFRKACEAVGQDDHSQQDLWLLLFRDLGYVHYLGDRIAIRRRPENVLADYLFRPAWVKGPVYEVMRLKEAQPTGIVSGNRVNAALKKDGMSDKEVRLLLALMLESELIFHVRGPGSHPDIPDYLIPDQVDTRPKAIKFEWSSDPEKKKFCWKFPFLPDHLLARLVGRWFDEQAKGFVYYRDEVILTRRDTACRLCLRADFNQHLLDLEFDGKKIESLKARLTEAVQDLLDPERIHPGSLWEEEDLTVEPESINEDQIKRIAEALLKMAKMKYDPGLVEIVSARVMEVFQKSNGVKNKLTDAQKLAYRICMLFAFAKADMAKDGVEGNIPKPVAEEMGKVRNWLVNEGATIAKCFENDPANSTLNKLLAGNPGSFTQGYRSARKKLGISEASLESLERHVQEPSEPLEDD